MRLSKEVVYGGEKCVSKPEISRRVSGTSQHCGEVGEEGNKVG